MKAKVHIDLSLLLKCTWVTDLGVHIYTPHAYIDFLLQSLDSASYT